jgi:hypothetical protein
MKKEETSGTKLRDLCSICIIRDCRFRESDDRYEFNCPADPRAFLYDVPKPFSPLTEVKNV